MQCVLGMHGRTYGLTYVVLILRCNLTERYARARAGSSPTPICLDSEHKHERTVMNQGETTGDSRLPGTELQR